MSSPPGRIQRLDEAVVNRIAAGEVIQRPANAVKEMIENSLDAGANAITVSVKSGGLKVLQIQDDGKGIHKEDMPIVCERFTTSKLKTFSDLQSIATFGFRGEALASISHVAHVTITSRTADSSCAYKASYSDGKVVEPSSGKAGIVPCAGNVGTQIHVEDLFYNMPTRRKALRSANDEFNRLLSVVTKYAVHNAGVAFCVKKIGEPGTHLRTVPNASLLDNIRSVYGSSVANELIEIEHEDDQLQFKMKGMFSNANYSVKKQTLLLFINNRLVESSNVKKALDAVYAPYLPKNTHSWAYISLSIDPARVDVNVHPTKKEVHFISEDEIIESIQQAVSARLVGSNQSRTFQTQLLVQPSLDAGHSSPPPKRAKASSRTQGEDASSSQAGTKPSYAYDMVRTDSRSQRIDKFVRVEQTSLAEREAPLASQTARRQSLSNTTISKRRAATLSDSEAADADDWDPIRMKPKRRKSSAQPADDDASSAHGPAAASSRASDALVRETVRGSIDDPAGDVSDTDKDDRHAKRRSDSDAQHANEGDRDTLDAATSPPFDQDLPQERAKTVGRPYPYSATPLLSVRTVREEIRLEEHPAFRRILQDHSYVGCVNANLALVQHQTSLYILKTREIREELFYQLVFRGFGSFSTISLSPPTSVRDLILIALESPESKWTEDDGSKEEFSEQVAEFLAEKAPMLEEYFALSIDSSGNLVSLPLLLDGYIPSLRQLPLFLLRLATDAEWDEEQACFESVAREIGRFYQEFDVDAVDALRGQHHGTSDAVLSTHEFVVQHILLPAFRTMYYPSKRLADAGCVLKVADLKDLYKVFERC